MIETENNVSGNTQDITDTDKKRPLVKERKISEVLTIQVDFLFDDDTTVTSKISEGDVAQINYINSIKQVEETITGRVSKICLMGATNQAVYRTPWNPWNNTIPSQKEYAITVDYSKEYISNTTNIFVSNILSYTLVSDLGKEEPPADNPPVENPDDSNKDTPVENPPVEEPPKTDEPVENPPVENPEEPPVEEPPKTDDEPAENPDNSNKDSGETNTPAITENPEQSE